MGRENESFEIRWRFREGFRHLLGLRLWKRTVGLAVLFFLVFRVMVALVQVLDGGEILVPVAATDVMPSPDHSHGNQLSCGPPRRVAQVGAPAEFADRVRTVVADQFPRRFMRVADRKQTRLDLFLAVVPTGFTDRQARQRKRQRKQVEKLLVPPLLFVLGSRRFGHSHSSLKRVMSGIELPRPEDIAETPRQSTN